MEPILCASGCAFFGTAENRNMCSMCYNDFLKQEIITKSKSIATVDQLDNASSSPESQHDFLVSEVTAQSGGLAVEKNRCNTCNKKVGLMGFQCQCGKLLCGTHQLPEVHACNVDFKTITVRNDRDLAEIITGDELKWRAP